MQKYGGLVGVGADADADARLTELNPLFCHSLMQHPTFVPFESDDLILMNFCYGIFSFAA